jgi:hypothetical protein
MGAIVYQKDSGLGHGIDILGQVLSGVVRQRALQNQFRGINDQIGDEPITVSTLQKIISQPGGMEYVQTMMPVLQGVLKERERRAGSSAAIENILNPGAQGSPQMPYTETGNETQPSPIEEARALKVQKATRPSGITITPKEESESVPSNSRGSLSVPNVLSPAESNRKSPVEQSRFQQGGNASMGLNPSMETNRIASNEAAAAQPSATPALSRQSKNLPVDATANDKYTIEDPNYGTVSRRQIDQLLSAPYAEANRLGESLDRRWSDTYKQSSREAAEIRKENRQEIKSYAEPYKDISKLRGNLGKLEKARELIESGKVSVDGNWFRNTALAIAEGREEPYAEMIKTKEQQELWYLLRDSLKPKEVGGSNPSTKEVLIAMSSLPSPYKDQAANQFIVENMINKAKADVYKAEQISGLRSKESGSTFPVFQGKIESATEKYMEEQDKLLSKKMGIINAKQAVKDYPPKDGFVWMVAPDGSPRQVRISDAKWAQQSGGVLIQ